MNLFFKNLIEFTQNEKYFFLSMSNKLNIIAFDFSEFLNYDPMEEISQDIIFEENDNKKRVHKFMSNLSSNKLQLNGCNFEGAEFENNFKEICFPEIPQQNQNNENNEKDFNKLDDISKILFNFFLKFFLIK